MTTAQILKCIETDLDDRDVFKKHTVSVLTKQRIDRDGVKVNELVFSMIFGRTLELSRGLLKGKYQVDEDKVDKTLAEVCKALSKEVELEISDEQDRQKAVEKLN